MRDLHRALQSLRSAFICASAALLIVACGDSSDKEQNPNPGTSTSSDAGSGGTNGGNTKPAEKKGLGAACEKADECETNNCRAFSVVPDPTKPEEKVDGKTCSACNADADCTDPAKGNLCVPGLAGPSAKSLYFHCGKGDFGGGCIDNTHCSEGRVCGDIAGGVRSCGECATNADCKDAAKPSCVIKQEGTGIWRVCAEKLPDGKPCSGGEGSDEECQNYCAPITNSLIPVKVGVCSPCKEDSHCAAGQKCKPPGVDGSDIANLKLLPAKCEAAEQGSTGTETGTENNTSGATTTTTTENNSASSTDSTT